MGNTHVHPILASVLDLASFPSDATAVIPPITAISGAPAALPNADPNGRPGNLTRLPKQGRGGDVRNAPHPPVPFGEHILNRHHPVFVPAPDGDAA